MFDAHCAVPPPMLIQFAAPSSRTTCCSSKSRPCRATSRSSSGSSSSISIPLATGERDRTIWGMLPYLQERCIDILQPDCGHTGGITQMKKIATLAEAYFVPLAPHCTCTRAGPDRQPARHRRDPVLPDPRSLSRRPHDAARRRAEELGPSTTTATPRCRKGRAWAWRSTSRSSTRSTPTPSGSSNGPRQRCRTERCGITSEELQSH